MSGKRLAISGLSKPSIKSSASEPRRAWPDLNKRIRSLGISNTPPNERPIPTGQENGTASMPKCDSTSASTSKGGWTSRSSLLMNVMIGVLRARQTSNNRIVCGSTPLAASITMSAASTAVNTRYVSSEKSWWPGVSRRLMTQSWYSICITEEATEIPRCFSISIQSEAACRDALRALTLPAIWIAPANSRIFSVRVVLPASG